MGTRTIISDKEMHDIGRDTRLILHKLRLFPDVEGVRREGLEFLQRIERRLRELNKANGL